MEIDRTHPSDNRFGNATITVSTPTVPTPAATSTATAVEEKRFAFGANWDKFLSKLTDERVAAAVESLQRVFGKEGLQGRRFLDIGSGSGLFSLAASRLGAHVVSFDYDGDSVACTLKLRKQAQVDERSWRIEQGSVLDETFLQQLGEFDVVYSWGVLHHTGDMWRAVELAGQRVAPGGTFWIAIYNDQGLTSRIWRAIKIGYVRLPNILRTPYVLVVGGSWMAYRGALRLMQMGAATLLRLITRNDPFRSWRNWRNEKRSQSSRGMHRWYDLVDWIGGYPFEVAKPEEIFRFLRDRGFELTELSTCGAGLGCNEFIFHKKAVSTSSNCLEAGSETFRQIPQ